VGAGKGTNAGSRLPVALTPLPAGRSRLPSDFVKRNQRARILAAALAVFGEEGLAGTTVQDLIREAHVSRATFYGFFPDKEHCLLALCQETYELLSEEALAAIEQVEPWPHQVRAAVWSAIAALGSDPRLSRVALMEALAGGEPLAGWRAEATAELAAGLARGRRERPWGVRLPELLEPVMIGGALSLVGRRLGPGSGSDPEAELPRLAAELTEILLTPYLGASQARRVAASAPPRLLRRPGASQVGSEDELE
jgi:AcrR family transcriptional regulator